MLPDAFLHREAKSLVVSILLRRIYCPVRETQVTGH
jgi:hypothetical protein